MFLMVDSNDHVTGKTGLSPTVTLSKAGGAFASPAGIVAAVGSGWYKVAGNATDTATLGPLVLHATGTGADPCDVEFVVVAFDPLASLATPTNITAASGVAVSSIAANAVNASALATDAVTEIQSGLATAANLATVASYLDTEIAVILAIVQKLDTALELNGGLYRFTIAALAQAPAGGGGGATDWTADERTALRTILGIPATGTTPEVPAAGALKVIDDFLDTEIAAIKAKTDGLPADTSASLVAINALVDTVETEVGKVLKTNEQRTISRAGQPSITFTETRE